MISLLILFAVAEEQNQLQVGITVYLTYRTFLLKFKIYLQIITETLKKNGN